MYKNLRINTSYPRTLVYMGNPPPPPPPEVQGGKEPPGQGYQGMETEGAQELADKDESSHTSDFISAYFLI